MFFLYYAVRMFGNNPREFVSGSQTFCLSLSNDDEQKRVLNKEPFQLSQNGSKSSLRNKSQPKVSVYQNACYFSLFAENAQSLNISVFLFKLKKRSVILATMILSPSKRAHRISVFFHQPKQREDQKSKRIDQEGN